MRLVDLDEIYTLCRNSYDDIWSAAKSQGRTPSCSMHWSAGRYDTPFADYHLNILGDGRIMASTDDMSKVLPHTWKRNTGTIGISLCCAYQATTDDLGEFPPTAAQIETMAQVIATVANALDLTIDKNHVFTHGEEAANEVPPICHPAYACWNDECGDGDVRWDLEFLGTTESPSYNPWATDGSRGGDVLRGKSNYYRQKWSEG